MTRRYGPKTRTADQQRAQMVQLLTMRDSLDGLTAGDVSRWCGLSEPECAAALERERLFRMRRA